MPWRNGGGSTREVARAPTEGEDFAWRVSVARIEADGPFSRFPGIDRTLWLLAGAGMELRMDGALTRLTERFASVRFGGEAEVTARLLAGPTDDLNVMVDRARAQVTAEVLELAGTVVHTWHTQGAGTDLIVALSAEVSVTTPGGRQAALGVGDALRLDEATGPRAWRLHAARPLAVLVATFA